MTSDSERAPAPASSNANDLPTPRQAPKRQRRFSAIWLVPLLAIAIGLGLAIQAVMMQGPEITLTFTHAEGLEAGKTRVKFKDVDVGTVTSIVLDKSMKFVRVSIQMTKDAEDMLVKDSRLWVVRPRVAVGGISGLTTLLSGAYIAIDPGTSKERQHNFVGLEVPPVVTGDTPGQHFLLSADSLGSLDVTSPVYYRRIPVGQVIGYDLRKDGSGVDIRVFINAPYDRFVSSRSRFWQASGLDVSMSAEGFKFNMESLTSLMLGGIAFSSPSDDGAENAAPRKATDEPQQFVLYADSASARRVPDTIVQPFTMVFNESVRGLTVGAPVDFRGLTIGEVSSISLARANKKSDQAIAVEVHLYPERFTRHMRMPGKDLVPGALQPKVDTMIANGLRAQLRTGSLLSGQLYVSLDFFSNAKPGKITWDQSIPEFPTQSSTAVSIEDQLLDLSANLKRTLNQVERLVTRFDSEITPEAVETLKAARRTLEFANRTLSSDSPLQQETRDALREVGRAAKSVRDLADLLERKPEALLTGK